MESVNVVFDDSNGITGIPIKKNNFSKPQPTKVPDVLATRTSSKKNPDKVEKL